MSSASIEPVNNFETNAGSFRTGAKRPGGAAPKPKGAGRYDGVRSNTREVPGGRAQVNARLRTVQPAAAAVEDPYGGRERIIVTVNRRTDLLEMERSHGRISEAAYMAGQQLQRVFERLGYGGVGAASLDGAGGGDAVKAVSDRIEKMLESAEACRAMMDGVRRQLGMIDTRLLRRLLGDRMSFAECAAQEGKAGERGAAYVASRFRDAVEDLAEAWASKGARRDVPDDKHARRADQVTQMRLDPTGKT